MNRPGFVIALIVFLLQFYGAASAETEDYFIGGFPLKIHRLMKKKECSPIKRFYDRKFVLEPPFLYVNMAGKVTVALVCQIDKPTE